MTEDQRSFISGEKNDVSPSAERKRRSIIRTRIENALYDLALVFSSLDNDSPFGRDDLRLVFEGDQSANDDLERGLKHSPTPGKTGFAGELSDALPPQPKSRENKPNGGEFRSRKTPVPLQRAMVGSLALLLSGCREGELDIEDFLKSGLQEFHSIYDPHLAISGVNIQSENTRLYKGIANRAAAKMREGEPLEHVEVTALLHEGQVDPNRVQEYVRTHSRGV